MKSDHEIEMIAPNGKSTLHAYFDLCPESPSGTRFTYFEFEDQVPGPGRIVMAAADNTHHCPLGPVVKGAANIGARQQWTDDCTVAYGFGESGTGKTLLMSADGSTRTVPGVIRMAAPDGSFAMTATHESRRFETDHTDEHVVRIDLAEGTLTPLFNRADVMAIHPMRDQFAESEIEYLRFKHTKISPTGTRFFCVFNNEELLRYKPMGPNIKTPRVKSLICANVDGSNMHYVGEFGHHPFWHWRGNEIWAAQPAAGAQNFLAYDPDTGATRIVAEGIVAAHTALNPCAELFAMDAFDRKAGTGRLLLYDLETKTQTVLAEFDAPDITQETGCHPHPVWSRDGRTIYFNVSEEQGKPSLCRMCVDRTQGRKHV